MQLPSETSRGTDYLSSPWQKSETGQTAFVGCSNNRAVYCDIEKTAVAPQAVRNIIESGRSRGRGDQAGSQGACPSGGSPQLTNTINFAGCSRMRWLPLIVEPWRPWTESNCRPTV